MSMTHDFGHIKEFYAQQLDTHGPHSPHALHWNSTYTQEKRFIMLSLIDDLTDRSVLDVGSGVGDLYGFLEAENIRTKYTGWDISEDMVKASQKKYPRARFEVQDILKEKTAAAFDYVVASGTMNVKIRDHDRFVYEMIAAMYRKAAKGVAFNLLSSSSPDKDDFFYYAEPEKIFGYCRELTPYVSLMHDYLPGDFTVYMHRKI